MNRIDMQGQLAAQYQQERRRDGATERALARPGPGRHRRPAAVDPPASRRAAGRDGENELAHRRAPRPVTAARPTRHSRTPWREGNAARGPRPARGASRRPGCTGGRVQRPPRRRNPPGQGRRR